MLRVVIQLYTISLIIGKLRYSNLKRLYRLTAFITQKIAADEQSWHEKFQQLNVMIFHLSL